MNWSEILWSDWPAMKRRAHVYALDCLAHRLCKFGFETSVNRLDPKSLVYLSQIAHQPFAQACLDEALMQDPALREWLLAQVHAA